MVHKNGNYVFSEAFTSWLIGICKKNGKERHFCAILRGVSKKHFSIFQVFWTVYFALCHIHMGHQDQDGGKDGQMSLFDQKLEAATDREKQKFIHFQVLLSYLSWCSIKNSSFRFLAKSRVCTVRPKWGVFSKFSKYSFFPPLFTQLVKKLPQWSMRW